MSDIGNKQVFAKNLETYMKINNIDRSQLCTALGIKYPTVSAWLSASKYPRIDKIEMLANYFGIQKSDLIENKEHQMVSNTLTSNVSHVVTGKMRMIPVFESVSAGFGAVANNYVVDYIPLIIDCDSEAKETICIKVTGDSMYPKIEDGDLIVVHKQTSIDSGRVGVFLVDNEDALVKKVTYVSGEPWLELHSFNPEYQTKRFEGPDVERVQVLGLVKQVIKSI